MIRIANTFILTIALFLSGYSQYEKALETLLNNSTLKHAQVGVKVVDMASSELIFEHQADKYFVPASTQKLITTAAAYFTFGSNHTFTTTTTLEGSIKGDTLFGNIIVLGGRDPSFIADGIGENYLQKLHKALLGKGIKVVKGSIIVRPEPKKDATPQDWSYADISNYYGAAAYEFNFMENAYEVEFKGNEKKGNSVEIIEVTPEMPYQFDCQLTAGLAGSGDQAYILGAPFSNERIIVGTIPEGKSEFTIKGAMSNPGLSFSGWLQAELKNMGFEVLNLVYSGKSANVTPLFTTSSEYFTDLIETTNFHSKNLYAEAFLLELGKGDREDGLDAIDDWLNEIGIENDAFKVSDGAGLSKKNLATPNGMVDLLEYIILTEPSFQNLLPVSGASGTMRYFNSSRLKLRFQAKSGTLDGVMNYVGYLRPEDNNSTYGVALMINNYSGSRYELRRALVTFMESFL